MPPVSCHVLDTVRGRPAAGVVLALYRIADLPSDDNEIKITDNKVIGLAKTNKDGRVENWVFDPKEDLSHLGIKEQVWVELVPGIYKIRFQTAKYFKRLQQEDREKGISSEARTFFPFVDIVFTIESPPDKHYHVPLLLANHSYTTYRGS